jgi:hypothetical protein
MFIGTTNENGEVDHKFEDTGLFMVVAFKDGYIPAIHRISITLVNERVLAIKAPDQAGVGEEVTITVFERTTSTLVEGAAVYALQIINADITTATGSVSVPVSVPVVEQTTEVSRSYWKNDSSSAIQMKGGESFTNSATPAPISLSLPSRATSEVQHVLL